MDQFTRRLVGVGVQRGPVNGADLCRMFNAAIHGQGTAQHLSTDHDPLFEAHRGRRIFGFWRSTKSRPYLLCPCHTHSWNGWSARCGENFSTMCCSGNAGDRERKLADFQVYYNAARSHASLDGHTPLTLAGGHAAAHAELNNVRWVSPCRDLVQLPVAA
jgi:putative transposase